MSTLSTIGQLLKAVQHHSMAHRRVNCPECGLEFGTWKVMNQVRFTLPLIDRLPKSVQHYVSEHNFECPMCDCVFTTQAGVDQVHFRPMDIDQALTCPLSTMKQIIALSNAPNAIANSRPRKRWFGSVPAPELGAYLLTPSSTMRQNTALNAPSAMKNSPCRPRYARYVLFPLITP